MFEKRCGEGKYLPADAEIHHEHCFDVVPQTLAAPGTAASATQPGAASNPAPTSAEPAPVTTGLGAPIDQLAGKAPTLQCGPNGGGSHANRAQKIVTLDGNLANNPATAVQMLAHEVGMHAMAMYPTIGRRPHL